MPFRIVVLHRIVKLVTARALGDVKLLGSGNFLVGQPRHSSCVVDLRNRTSCFISVDSLRRFASHDFSADGNDNYCKEQAHQKLIPTINRMFTRSWPSSSKWRLSSGSSPKFTP